MSGVITYLPQSTSKREKDFGLSLTQVSTTLNTSFRHTKNSQVPRTIRLAVDMATPAGFDALQE